MSKRSCWDVLAAAGLDSAAALPESRWRTARIRAGLVDIGAENTEKYTPHMINLDRSGAVSFTKGCYTGQEVVARTENLGRVKRRVMRFGHSADDVSIGDKLEAGDGGDAGTVVNASPEELLAIVSVDDELTGLSLGGSRLDPLPLPYSTS